jgi:hypothetical protein
LQKQMMFTKKSVLYSVTYDAMVLEEPWPPYKEVYIHLN